MSPLECALLCERFVNHDKPTFGCADSASSVRVYDTPEGPVHCFQETHNLDGIIHDIEIETDDVPGLGRVHHGFWTALHPLLADVLALPHPVAVTGHSLGGAMAIMYGVILANEGHAAPIYAIESPRLTTTNDMAATIINKNIPWYASRNGNDWITQLPPGFMLPGPLTSFGEPALPFDNIEDHKIENVVAALRKQAAAFNA